MKDRIYTKVRGYNVQFSFLCNEGKNMHILLSNKLRILEDWELGKEFIIYLCCFFIRARLVLNDLVALFCL